MFKNNFQKFRHLVCYNSPPSQLLLVSPTIHLDRSFFFKVKFRCLKLELLAAYSQNLQSERVKRKRERPPEVLIRWFLISSFPPLP